jgi:hypothetical protein
MGVDGLYFSSGMEHGMHRTDKLRRAPRIQDCAYYAICANHNTHFRHLYLVDIHAACSAWFDGTSFHGRW